VAICFRNLGVDCFASLAMTKDLGRFRHNPLVLILVPSHNDAECLKQSLPRIREAMRPKGDELVVIADRCSDETREVAAGLGAIVLDRTDDRRGGGKRGALLHALAEVPGAPSQAVAVFDADSIPSIDFFGAAGASDASAVFQAFVDPAPNRNLVSRLAAYSEIVSQKISDRLRERSGWGIPLRGTGMVVPRAILERELARCETFVEDLELTVLLADRGIRVRRLSASVLDPKPEAFRGIVAQRARWLAGNFSALIVRRREIGRLARSAEGATLVLSLFCKPRSLFFSARLVLFLGLFALSPSPAVVAARIALALFLAKDLALLVGGLWAVDRPLFYLPAVLCSPLYPLMWAAGLVRSFGARRAWLSARHGA
jgi:cellulose synthase/poly-beta-1,6-N-acetylglucosamine synthase-like glycosyltransferase